MSKQIAIVDYLVDPNPTAGLLRKCGSDPKRGPCLIATVIARRDRQDG